LPDIINLVYIIKRDRLLRQAVPFFLAFIFFLLIFPFNLSGPGLNLL
jgi:hypothetical protein